MYSTCIFHRNYQLNVKRALNSFMLVGRTKFSPDHHFGYFNQLLCHASVSTLLEIVHVVQRSMTTTTHPRPSSGKFLATFQSLQCFLCSTILPYNKHHNVSQFQDFIQPVVGHCEYTSIFRCRTETHQHPAGSIILQFC